MMCGFALMIATGLLALCIAGSYNIIKQTQNPELYRKYEINGNATTLAIKEF